jgi:dipeptide/tripeptide permease
VVEVLENLAFLANASNLVTYLMGSMHYSPSQSATTVTNFMGTAFLLALLGGFLSDAFFTTYTIYIVSAFIEFMVRCTNYAPKIHLLYISQLSTKSLKTEISITHATSSSYPILLSICLSSRHGNGMVPK